MHCQQLLCDVSRVANEQSHPGTRGTHRLMSARVIWHGMSSDIAAWCQDCQQCARGKASPQPAALIQPIPVPERRFTHAHVDIVGPLPTSAVGFSYLFTMVDRFTRRLEVVPIKSITAQQCVDIFIATWVARYGLPATITSDQGRQFTSALWTGLHKLLGVHLINTPHSLPSAE
jgi:hypothetical protein